MKNFKKISIFLFLFISIISIGGCKSSDNKTVDSNNKTILQTVDEIHPDKDFKFTKKVSSLGFEKKLENFLTEVMSGLHKQGQSFSIMVFPVDSGMILLTNLNEFFTKRYDDPSIKAEFLKKEILAGNNYQLFVYIGHLGGFDNDDGLPVPSNFYEYFFLENDKGEFVRAIRQEKDSFTAEINFVVPQVQFMFAFPADEVDKIMKNGTQLFLKFDGLKITDDNKIKLKYPFSKYYSDEFPEIGTMIKEIHE